ncbi:MAG: glycosyltransferase [Treponema sp.]|nr:glycosyltransferase [Treponema sp.]
MEKKKILFINNNFMYSDGTARALINLVNNLDPEKFDISVMSLYICDMDLAKELRKDIKLLKCFGFYFRGFKRIVKLLPAKFWYKRFVKDTFDIEVAFQCDLPTFMIDASLNRKAKHIFWMHGWDNYPAIYKKADKVVCVSKTNEERCRLECNGNVNVTHLYNIVDNRIIEKASENSAAFGFDFTGRKKPLFVSVGRLSPEKGYVRLVHIMKDLKDEGFGFTLVIVGGGAEESAIRSAVKECSLEDEVYMTGAVNVPHNITVQADAFICSSFSEGYSTACTEAAVLGIPVITTDVPGGKEIIDSCECGLLTGKDDESLKGGIRKVLQNPDLLEEWKEKMKTTKEHFSMTARVSEMNEFFNEIYRNCEA